MLKRIHVNQHIIKGNRKTGARVPPLTVKTYKDNTLGNEVHILNEQEEAVAKVIYRPDNPLECGAHVWIETSATCKVL